MVTLKSSSLIESVIAVVIIGIVFSIGLTVMEQTISTSDNPAKFRLHQKLRSLADEIKLTQNYKNETIKTEGFVIEKTIKPYNNDKNILFLHLTATDQEHQISENYNLLLSL